MISMNMHVMMMQFIKNICVPSGFERDIMQTMLNIMPLKAHNGEALWRLVWFSVGWHDPEGSS